MLKKHESASLEGTWTLEDFSSLQLKKCGSVVGGFGHLSQAENGSGI